MISTKAGACVELRYKMLKRLLHPFRKRYDKYAGRASAFIAPIRKATNELLGRLPGVKSFAGAEDPGDETEPASRKGLLARLKAFKNSLKDMSDFQKLILLTVAVVVPAGILLASLLVGVLKKHREK